ncbi:MAG: hypothetical protein JWL97_4527, partial [Gemmatimonadales bacterium]|nr:hypothetical protein [Gemmatimonadales bacterium]
NPGEAARPHPRSSPDPCLALSRIVLLRFALPRLAGGFAARPGAVALALDLSRIDGKPLSYPCRLSPMLVWRPPASSSGVSAEVPIV